MLGCLRRRGARKKPKRLRALRFRTVGPWLYLGLDRRKGLYCGAPKGTRSTPIRRFGRSWQTRQGRTSHGALPTARKLGETRVCVRDWQTQGDSMLRKKNGVSRRAWKRSRGCARTLQDSFAEVDRRSWLREALPPLRSRSKEGPGDAVDGGLAYGCTESFLVESAVPGGPRQSNEALRCEAKRGGGSRRRRNDRFPAGGVRNTTQAGSANALKSGGRDPRRSSRRAIPRATGRAIAARESGRRAAHPLSNEGAPDREKLRRVTAAG
jgi:hypothetical protein